MAAAELERESLSRHMGHEIEFINSSGRETEPLTVSINGVLTLMGNEHYVKVYWGITWLVLILCALTDVMILKSERGMKFLSVIASFLIFRILLFGSSLSHVASFDKTTGNRILFHILPICITYIFYLSFWAFMQRSNLNQKTTKH